MKKNWIGKWKWSSNTELIINKLLMPVRIWNTQKCLSDSWCRTLILQVGYTLPQQAWLWVGTVLVSSPGPLGAGDETRTLYTCILLACYRSSLVPRPQKVGRNNLVHVGAQIEELLTVWQKVTWFLLKTVPIDLYRLSTWAYDHMSNCAPMHN